VYHCLNKIKDLAKWRYGVRFLAFSPVEFRKSSVTSNSTWRENLSFQFSSKLRGIAHSRKMAVLYAKLNWDVQRPRQPGTNVPSPWQALCKQEVAFGVPNKPKLYSIAAELNSECAPFIFLEFRSMNSQSSPPTAEGCMRPPKKRYLRTMVSQVWVYMLTVTVKSGPVVWSLRRSVIRSLQELTVYAPGYDERKLTNFSRNIWDRARFNLHLNR
jgi:hypothetical protein